MKTTKEMIEVMQAYLKGEQIERSFFDLENWENVTPNFKWNWQIFDYRIKPKNKYVPFESAEEFLEAQDKHDIILKCIKTHISYKSYINKNKELLLLDKNWFMKNISFETLFNEYVFEDGTPCGKEVEE